MGFDGLFFTRVTSLLQEELTQAHLNKIQQVSDFDFLFQCYGKNGSIQLFCSLQPSLAHITLSKKKWSDFIYPGHFVSLLRKHIEDSKILKLEQIGYDRILKITFVKRNEISELQEKSLYIELTGKFTNLILVSEEDQRIIDALHRIPPLEQTIRTIQPGAVYRALPLEGKKDPLTQVYEEGVTLSKQFHGVSALLEKEIHYRLDHNEEFSHIISEIMNSKTLYIHETEKDKDYYFIELTHLPNKAKTYPWDEGLELFYHDKIQQQKYFQLTHDLEKIIKRDLKRNKQKVEKLEVEIEQASHFEQYRYYGDLLFTYGMDQVENAKSITIYDEMEQKEVTIPLNPLLDIKQNANVYYKRYRKGQTSMVMVQEQIDKTKLEVEYLETIELQLQENDIESIEQIRQELKETGYLKATKVPVIKKGKNKPKKVVKYLPMTFTSKSGIGISVGRNNLQNEYLTFTLAKYNELFLHVKDYPGSHVVIHAQQIDEDTLRMAANLAAYHSKARYSSTVGVDYTLIKNVKKPKNAKPGMVYYHTNKTIYIDPVDPKTNQGGA